MDLLFGFSGRIGRLQWWLGQLAILGVWVVGIGALALVIGVADPSAEHAKGELSQGGWSILAALLACGTLSIWINIATTVKRFHDRDKSGWWFCIVFVPYVGAIWQIVECGFLSGKPGGNRFGPSSGGGIGFDADDEIEAHIGRLRAERARLEGKPAPAQKLQPAPAAAPTPVVPARRPTGPTGFGRRGV